MWITRNLNLTGRARSQKKTAGQRQNTMGKSNTAEKTATVAEVVESVVIPTMTVVKEEKVEEAARKLTLEERIQKVEDLSMLIERWKTLHDSRRKLQTFQIGADSLSSVVSLRDANGNEFKTSNSAVISSVIDEMKRTLDTKIRDVESQINL
ncbi:MAG TPA: hypothetical protein DHV48_10630 [Prolixibacteraceae bacterium]|nr:hypothetical protein [Prolixibacteraceae bacterium]